MRKSKSVFSKFISCMLALIIVMSNIPNIEVFATESNYVEIWTAEDLDNVRNNTKLNYRLMADIDLTDYISKTNTVDKGWYPLGYGNHFTGIFDGNGHTISGLWSSQSWGISYKGLFSVITNGAVVKDLNIELDERGITGGYEVGGITGVAKNGAVISNCTVSGGKIVVTGGGYAGGIVGFTYGTPSVTLDGNTVINTLTQTSGNYSGGIVGVAGSGTKIVDCKAIDTISKANSYAGGIAGGLNGKSSIENAYTNGKVEISGNYAGGLVGVVYEGSSIKSGYAEGDVNSSHYAGGLVGTLYDNSTISESYATGNVSTKYYISGGLVGEVVASTISNSYARGNVTGTTGVGGLVGYFSGSGTSNNKSVENSYSTGVVTGQGTTEYGAFSGHSGVVFKGINFYDSETASIVQAYGTSGNPQGETIAFPQGKSTVDMMKKSTFTGWDFENIWAIDEGNDYPVFAVNFEGGEGEDGNTEIEIPEVEDLPITLAPNEIPDLPEPEFDNTTITRGEWISMLLEKLEININSEQYNIIQFFGDSSNSEYGTEIEIANLLGILPPPESKGYIDPEQDIPLFEPEKVATREFAVYTVVKAMGFIGTYSVDCSDSASLKFPNEDAIAIQQGFLKLENNMFNPNSPLTGTDKNRIFIAIDELNKATEITEEYDNTVYIDGVVKDDLADIIDYNAIYNNDGTITVTLPKNDKTINLDGKVFILPRNDDFITEIALKGLHYTNKSGDYVTLICVEPKIQEVVRKIDFAGNGIIDFNNIVVADGVTMVVLEDSVNTRIEVDTGGTFEPKTSLRFKVEEYNTEISFTLEDIATKLDADISFKDGIELREFLFKIKDKYKVEASLTLPKKTKIPLGNLPVTIGTTGLNVNFDLFLNLGVDGTASLALELVNENGLQIKNGAVRNISNKDFKIKPAEISAGAKIGISLNVALEWTIWPLIQFDNSFNGIASYTNILNYNHNCAKVDTKFEYKVSLNEDENLIGFLLKHLTNGSLVLYKYDYDAGTLHLENFQFVNSCSLGGGKVIGKVMDYETGTPIKNARIKTGSLTSISLTYTDNNGEFVFDNLNVGNNNLVISATSYMTYKSNVNVVANDTTYVESLLMIDRVQEGLAGNISGIITNSVSGSQVPAVTINVRKNWNNVDGEIIDVSYSEDGTYSLDLPVGYYTLEFKKDRYFTTNVNINIVNGLQLNKPVDITPMFTEGADSFRVVLTWGAEPRDLDSHLTGPTVDGNGRFHTTFYNMSYDVNGENIVNLDLDDVSSYGPETTTVNKINENGIYSFYVHDFTNRDNYSNTKLASSQARVRIYSGNSLMGSFNVPVNGIGTVWHVFDYDSNTDQIIPVNNFSNSINDNTFVRNNEYGNIDKSNLISIVNEVNSAINLEDDYLLEKHIYIADLVLNDNNATQEEIDKLIIEIENLFSKHSNSIFIEVDEVEMFETYDNIIESKETFNNINDKLKEQENLNDNNE